jgi:hypothetical protein
MATRDRSDPMRVCYPRFIWHSCECQKRSCNLIIHSRGHKNVMGYRRVCVTILADLFKSVDTEACASLQIMEDTVGLL